MKYVNINNRIWAVGLHWKLAPAISRKDFIKKVQSLDENFDLICQHKRHYGFGVSGTGKGVNININGTNAEKMPTVFSLAAYLHMPSIIGMFKLEDIDGASFWWVLAIKDHSIVGTGDQVFETEKEAEDAILNLNELFNLDIADTIIFNSPADSIDWLSPHLRLDYLENLFGRARISPIHEDVQLKRKKAIIYIAVALILAIGTWNAGVYALEQKAINEQQAIFFQREQNKVRLLAQPAKQFIQEWQMKPLASDVAMSCLKSMQKIPININGWALNSLNCTAGKSLQLVWKHQAGANFIELPMNASLNTPQKASSRLNIVAYMPIRKKQDFTELMQINELMSVFYQICQATGTKIKISVKKPQKKTIDKIEIVSPWQKIEWTLSEIPALLMSEKLEFTRILAKIPGLCLERISFENNKWTFKGYSYALK